MNRESARIGLASERGMTLIEIIAVITLIAIIGAVVARGIFSTAGKAKAQLNVTKMEKVKAALEQYRLQYNSYPARLEDTIRPSKDAQQQGILFTPFLEESDLRDIWNAPYVYTPENNNRSFALKSLGSDGVEGGEADKQDVTLRP